MLCLLAPRFYPLSIERTAQPDQHMHYGHDMSACFSLYLPNLGHIAVPCNSGFPMPASIKSCPLDQHMDYGALDCQVIRAPIAVLEVAPLEVCPLQPLSAGGEVSHLRPQSRMGVKPPHTCFGVTDSIKA